MYCKQSENPGVTSLSRSSSRPKLLVHRNRSKDPQGLNIAAAIVAIPTRIRMARGTYASTSRKVRPMSGVISADMQARTDARASPEVTLSVDDIEVNE